LDFIELLHPGGFDVCWVFPMGIFPVLLHLTLWTAVEILHMLFWPLAPVTPVLQLQDACSKSLDCEFPDHISWKDLSQVGASVARQRQVKLRTVSCCFAMEKSLE